MDECRHGRMEFRSERASAVTCYSEVVARVAIVAIPGVLPAALVLCEVAFGRVLPAVLDVKSITLRVPDADPFASVDVDVVPTSIQIM